MDKDTGKMPKFDPNTEAFQMRAQWKKAEACSKQWSELWSWLLDEQRRALKEAASIREEAAAELPHALGKTETKKTLKPVPVTSSGIIGWLAAKPDSQLEIYTPWLTHIPLRLPDAWDDKNYVTYKS